MTQPLIYSHDAMNTTFALRMAGESESESAGVARECFEHLDYIETKLSRYIEGSDVWQINHMEAGQSLFLSEPCYDCLRLALDIALETSGLFDVSLGEQVEHVKASLAGPVPPLKGALSVDPGKPAIHCLEEGRQIDLGGIGKGFALDQMKARMLDWGIRSALLTAGSSTHLSFGNDSWEIELAGDCQRRKLHLHETALSASGTGIQGSHILGADGREPAYAFPRVWAQSASAARADAWSTAVMLMGPDNLKEQIPSTVHYLVEHNGQLLGNLIPIS